MNSEDLALLLGLIGGGFGGYFGGKSRDERERTQKKEDREEAAEFERKLAKQLREDARIEAETEKFKQEGRYTEGDNRGELKNPNSLYNFLFNPSESDPFHEMLGGGVLADSILGTTAYDDPNIRYQQREDFVANPDVNFLTTTGALGLGSLLIPGGAAVRALQLGKYLPRMFGGARGATSATPITDPTRLLASPMNQGGRVGYDNGGSIEDLLAEYGTMMHEAALGSFGINKGPILPGQGPGFMSALVDKATPNALVEQFRNLFGMETDYEKALKELDEAGMTEYDLIQTMLEN